MSPAEEAKLPVFKPFPPICGRTLDPNCPEGKAALAQFDWTTGRLKRWQNVLDYVAEKKKPVPSEARLKHLLAQIEADANSRQLIA